MNNQTGFRRIIRDIADLCELQIELFAIDSQVATQRTKTAAVYLGIAFVFALATVSTVTLGLAAALYEMLGWSLTASIFGAAGCAAIIAVFLAVLAVFALQKAVSALEETRSELAENLRWIKAAVIAPETSARAQVREDSFSNRYANARASSTN
tara:strand:+ start:77014 stop:77475 length:462 start_codon:yes stop_codon:yes gene_type:complete